MKLLRLSLKSFRQHLATELSFESGSYGIIGPNGSGKSTLLEAIAFGLFGSDAVRGKLDDIRPRGGGEEKGGRGGAPKVSITIEHDGLVYTVDRSLSSAELRVGGEETPIAIGNREVSQRITGILGMNYEEFSSAYFTEQKGLDFLSGQRGAADRERFIARMMGYDRLEKAHDLLRVSRRDTKMLLAGFDAAHESREALEARKESDTIKLRELEAQSKELARGLEESSRQAERATAVHEQMRAVAEKHQALSMMLTEREARFAERSSRIEQLAAEEKALTATKRSLEELLRELSDAEARSIDLDRVVGSARAKAAEIEATWKELGRSSERELARLRAELAEKQLEEVRVAGLLAKGVCPTCEQPLGKAGGHLHEKAASSTLYIKSKITELEAAALIQKNTPQELVSVRLGLSGAEHEQRRCREVVATLVKEREALLRQGVVAAELEKAREGLDQLSKELQHLRAERALLRFSEDEYRAAESTRKSSERLLNVARLQKSGVDGDMAKQRALVDRAADDLRKWDERHKKAGELREELVVIERSDEVMTGFRKHLNTLIRPRLAEIASECMAELTDGRYNQVEVAEDFTPTVIEDGTAKPVLSGGEEDILNLSMRLALSQMLADRSGHTMSFLVLDEVFGSLDTERRRNTLHLLDRLRIKFDQVFVITHLEDVKEGVENLIDVRFDERGFSEVVPGGAGERSTEISF